MKKPAIFFPLLIILFSINLLQAQSKLPSTAPARDMNKIMGNWAQKSSNAWQLGFFENFAIYKGDFWNYASVDINGSTGNVVLKKGSKLTKIELLLTTDELCEIAIDGKPKSTYFKCGKYLPDYTTPDTISFKDTRFQKVDTVTIRGYIRNNPGSKPFSVYFYDPVTGETAEFYANIDATGRFALKFPLLNTSQISFDWGGKQKMDVAEPGETYLLFFDSSSGQYLIMGDNERLHCELAGYEPYIPFLNMSLDEYLKREGLESMEYLKFKKADLSICNNHLDSFLIDHPLFSYRFKYYLRNYYRFEVASNLMKRASSLNIEKMECFPSGYMEYINDSLYQNHSVKPFTLVREYLFFMGYYVSYVQNEKGYKSFSGPTILDAIKYLQKSGRLKLTVEENQLIAKSEELNELVERLTKGIADSIQRTEAIHSSVEVNSRMDKIFEREIVKGFLKDEWPAIESEITGHKMLVEELAQIDTLVTDPLLKDLFEVKIFYRLFYERKTPLSNETYQLFREKIANTALAKPIVKLQNQFAKVSKQDVFYVESLKRTDHLKDAKDADALFAGLIKPYKGKVIYIDFWGTWCGPCKGELPFVGAVKEALKDKDVIFMYFANNSPEDTWKNVIKENHLTGENVVHYRLPEAQQAMIERRMSVRGFPTYILMDKLGNIVNMKAPRPSQKDQLVKEITKLLN